MYLVTKTYDHSLGLSACFRQPFAKSHCRDPHGYPLSFKFTFSAAALDENNWVVDFGGLKPIKEWLVGMFDHRTVLAANDPALADFQALYEKHGFAPVGILPFVGCEGFAKAAFDWVDNEFFVEHFTRDVIMRDLRLVSVEVREHGANSAIYTGART